MTDKGKTAEELSARIEELEAQLADLNKTKEEKDALTEQLTKLQSRFDNAEALISRQGTELGELRKGKSSDGASKGGGTSDAGPAGQTKEDTLEEVASAMTEQQLEVADQVFKALPDVEPDATGFSKAIIDKDPKARLKFLKIAQESVVSIPVSLKDILQKKAAGKAKPSVDEDSIRKLFNQVKEQHGFAPGGPGGGGSSGASGGPAGSGRDFARGTGVLQTIKRSSQA